jgi:hypothetical protein
MAFLDSFDFMTRDMDAIQMRRGRFSLRAALSGPPAVLIWRKPSGLFAEIPVRLKRLETDSGFFFAVFPPTRRR